MKKNVALFFILYLSLGQQAYVHGHNCSEHDQATIECVKNMVTESYNHVLEWYKGHAAVTNAVVLLGVVYLLYKKYCPVAHRCKECSLDSKL